LRWPHRFAMFVCTTQRWATAVAHPGGPSWAPPPLAPLGAIAGLRALLKPTLALLEALPTNPKMCHGRGTSWRPLWARPWATLGPFQALLKPKLVLLEALPTNPKMCHGRGTSLRPLWAPPLGPSSGHCALRKVPGEVHGLQKGPPHSPLSAVIWTSVGDSEIWTHSCDGQEGHPTCSSGGPCVYGAP